MMPNFSLAREDSLIRTKRMPMIKKITVHAATAVMIENIISPGFFLNVTAIPVVSFLSPIETLTCDSKADDRKVNHLPCCHKFAFLLQAVSLPVGPDLIF